MPVIDYSICGCVCQGYDDKNSLKSEFLCEPASNVPEKAGAQGRFAPGKSAAAARWSGEFSWLQYEISCDKIKLSEGAIIRTRVHSAFCGLTTSPRGDGNNTDVSVKMRFCDSPHPRKGTETAAHSASVSMFVWTHHIPARGRKRSLVRLLVIKNKTHHIPARGRKRRPTQETRNGSVTHHIPARGRKLLRVFRLSANWRLTTSPQGDGNRAPLGTLSSCCPTHHIPARGRKPPKHQHCAAAFCDSPHPRKGTETGRVLRTCSHSGDSPHPREGTETSIAGAQENPS